MREMLNFLKITSTYCIKAVIGLFKLTTFEFNVLDPDHGIVKREYFAFFPLHYVTDFISQSKDSTGLVRNYQSFAKYVFDRGYYYGRKIKVTVLHQSEYKNIFGNT